MWSVGVVTLHLAVRYDSTMSIPHQLLNRFHWNDQDSLWPYLFSDEMACFSFDSFLPRHYGDVIMGWMASQITNLTIVYLIVYSGAHQRKYQSFTSLAFVWGIHRGPVNSPHKWPVTWKMFPFDDVIMQRLSYPGLTRSISWLLMPWLFASPCHQQPSLTM